MPALAYAGASTQGRSAKEERDAKKASRFVPSSGNVFRDLDLPSAEEALAKAELAARIAGIIVGMKLTQAAAGEILEVDQSKISALMRGRLTDISTGRITEVRAPRVGGLLLPRWDQGIFRP